MRAIRNIWYECKKGTMPEDFDNVEKVSFEDPTDMETEDVEVEDRNGNTSLNYRDTDEDENGNTVWVWANPSEDIVAWKLLEPHKE